MSYFECRGWWCFHPGIALQSGLLGYRVSIIRVVGSFSLAVTALMSVTLLSILIVPVCRVSSPLVSVAVLVSMMGPVLAILVFLLAALASGGMMLFRLSRSFFAVSMVLSLTCFLLQSLFEILKRHSVWYVEGLSVEVL